MLEIEISYTWGSDEPTLASLVTEFSRQTGVQIHLRRLDWAKAWVDLFTTATEGEGSDVSIIGSTWVSTLAKMDALRPFTSDEVATLGPETAFLRPTWKNAKLAGDQRVWSIPWAGWMYVIFYRKDLLESIGIDPTGAFSTPDAVRTTLAALKTSTLEIPWLNADIPHPYGDTIHTAASWVWAAGGEFINPGGDRAQFDTPQAISGLVHWLDTYRSVAEQYQRLSVAECRELVMQGRAAAALVDINTAQTLLHPDGSSLDRENIGFANLSNIPWVGGGSFVIWDHTRLHPEREQAALDLVRFLSSKKANLRWMRQSDLLPLRLDALKECYPAGSPLQPVVTLAARQGGSYYNVPHWRRFEARVCLELGAIIQEARENPSADSQTILLKHLGPAARQLNLLLGK